MITMLKEYRAPEYLKTEVGRDVKRVPTINVFFFIFYYFFSPEILKWTSFRNALPCLCIMQILKNKTILRRRQYRQIGAQWKSRDGVPGSA